ncbi:MAG: hypothetical protein KC800_32840 [Candidatus Eremiobacteraeota bacterium]|nr:hypothetical protein [Candidatus Eremiobacteraeota bacterium]
MYPSIEKRVGSVLRTLDELTREAGMDMAAHQPNSSERADILSKWERHLGGVRSEYRDLEKVIRSSGDHTQEQREALLKRLKGLTKKMVMDRSLLEGLSRGEGPTPNQAGGAFPPPSDVPAALREVVESALGEGLRKFQEEATQSPRGELLDGFMSRCNAPLEEALKLIEAKLADHQGEVEELLEQSRRKLRSALGDAVVRRGETGADRTHRAVSQRLHHSLFQALESFRREAHPDSVDERSRQLEDWGREQLQKAREELLQASIETSLDEELVWFLAELKSGVGDVKGWWDGPPLFEKIYQSDLDPRVVSGPPEDSDGVFAEFYSDGHLRRVVAMRDGKSGGELRVWPDEARARYEDSANVAEFRPDGVIEEYGGRYERESRARIFFRDWVLRKVGEMLS